MDDKKSKTNLDGIIKLYIKWGQNSFLFTLICVIWLVWRIGTKPTRIGYPCSQFALGQIILFFSSTSTPILSLAYECISYIRKREYVKFARIVLIAAILLGGYIFYQNYQENELRMRGSGKIPAVSSVSSLWMPKTELETASQSFEFPSTISTEQAVVSFNHDSSAYYGGIPPYNPGVNPAYNFIWETVERLGLGSSSNPLDDLIDDGDTVLIKPNWVDFGPAVYTRPEVVRPLIDMAIVSGATTIYVGDGGFGVALTNTVMDSANYTAMVSELDSLHPGINIQTVNLNVLSGGWHWVYLGGDSSFAGSEYEHWQLGTGDGTLFDHTYYHQSDSQSVNPSGNVTGWYAVNDKVLDADVIINVPKMKTHQMMMATISIKNLVGCTLSSTFNEAGYMERIAHRRQPPEANYFDNDIFWRAILDMNKIILYADKDGVLQPTQQRMYLTVVDGIQAMEKSQHHIYGGGISYDRHVLLAGVDPAAVDAVGCRIMGYDYREIPSVYNADSDVVHPIGTNNPEKIVILGDAIDSAFSHVFEFNENWDQDADALEITDLIPPTINSINRQGNTVTANISGGLVAYIIYENAGIDYIEVMDKNGDIYSVTVSDSFSTYLILAQDEYFNTAMGALPTMEYLAEAEGRYYNSPPVFSNFGFDDDLALDDGWYQIDSYTGNWIALFNDIGSTSWDSDGWSLPGFDALNDGNHTIYFKVSDDAGYVEGESGEWRWQFYKDTTPPNDLTEISSSHTEGVWSSDNTIDVSWTDATDALSGLDGYSILWDTSPGSIPDQVKDIEEGIGNTTSPVLDDGDSHYFHISSVDNTGNWQSTVHLGPFYIDTTSLPTMESIVEPEGQYYNTAPVLSSISFDDNEALDDGWYQMDSYSGGWTELFIDATGTSWDRDNWEIPGFDALSDSSHTIYFMASDDAGNVAGESGEWSWQFYKDTVPPAAVSSLTAGNPTTNSIQLSWTAPGSDINTCKAAIYDIRYSTSNITPANWDSAMQCTDEPVPSVAGSTESFVATSLSSSTTYYFGLKTADQANNWSDISNIAVVVTSASSGGNGGSGGAGSGAPTLPGVTDVREFVTSHGVFRQGVTAKSEDGRVRLTVNKGTIGKTNEGLALSKISILEVEEPPAPPEDCSIIGLVYDISPDGATFEPTITLTISYDPEVLPEGILEDELYIGYRDGLQWLVLESAVNTEENTLSAEISHVTPFTVIGKPPPQLSPSPVPEVVPVPASFIISNLSITPSEVRSAEEVTISVMATNTGGTEGTLQTVLKVNGLEEVSKEVTLGAGKSEKVTFVVTRDTEGIYTVDIDGEVGQFTVITPVLPTTTQVDVLPVQTPTNGWLIGGIIAGCIVIAGLLFFFFVWRRRSALRTP